MKLKNTFTFVLVFISLSSFSQVMLYKKIQLEGETRVTDLLHRMTLDEKIDFLSGVGKTGGQLGQYDGTKGTPSLDISPFKVFQGPYGVNATDYLRKNGTYYPVSLNMASTWNQNLIERSMNSLSKELNAAGGQSNLGPAMNIIKDLRGGRSFEYFTEDPFLNGEIASAYVRGIQSQRNLAVLKHFVCNNQERERDFLNVKISERALREIYLPGFKAAVQKGGALALMTSYNKINGKPVTENQHLLSEILKDEWGFQGIVMTNWNGSGDSASEMIQAGVDLEMPSANQFTKEKILKAIEANQITESNIDEMVRRLLVVTFVSGVVDNYQFENPKLLATKENATIARKLAEESLILLKNEGKLLPLDNKKIKNIAVIGPNGKYGPHFREGKRTYQMLQGGGISSVAPPLNKMITPVAGLKALNKGAKIAFEPGCYGDHGCTEIRNQFLVSKKGKTGLNAEYYDNDDFDGEPIKQLDSNVSFDWGEAPAILQNRDQPFSVRWTGKIKAPKSRLYTFEIQAQGIARVYINKKLVINKRKRDLGWDKFAIGTTYLEEGVYDIRVEFKKTTSLNQCKLLWDYGNDEYLTRAINLAKKSRVVIMPVGTSGLIESEKIDRDEKLNRTESLALSLAQEKLIDEVSKVNKNVIVVVYSSGVVSEKWRSKVKAIIHAGFPGQEGGYALANVIYGKVNPSGKLTVTIPKSVDQYHKATHTSAKEINYDDGVFVGYRHFEKNNLEPAYPFGYGLSYTTFDYSNLVCVRPSPKNNKVTVRVTVKNTGSVEGKEVVQLYVSDVKSSVERPKKELKAFKKVNLAPGEFEEVSFILDDQAFAYFDEKSRKWVVEPGTYNIMVGGNSKDIKQTFSIAL
ncbi:glycoside hydrolase family 3 protein [Wenyingzhuangia sp. IMCC45533]